MTIPDSIRYRRATIEGVEIFYREAGPADAPVLLLLHGFPTSSFMFRNMIPVLADRHRIIAPDYPGFGLSAMPSRKVFEYSFAHYAKLMEQLLTQLNVDRFALYVMDYGAPVGFRLALSIPDRVSALIIQNGNAYEEGLSSFWNQLKAYWVDGSSAARDALRPLMSSEVTRFQYVDGVSDVARIDPSTWTYDQIFLDRPGNIEVQLDLFYDYRNNVALYPQFQAFFRDYQPPALIIWGAKDSIFPESGARAFLKDLPKAELHLFDSGHFAFEDKGPEMIVLMRDFLARHLHRS